MRRIAIYEQRGRPLEDFYILALIRHAWRKRGIEVVRLDDPRRTVDADAAILHTDVTRRHPDFDGLASRYPVVWNAGVRDVSKRMVSRELLSRDSDFRGPVIVKTDDNFFGVSEQRLARRSRNPFRSLRARLARRLSTPASRIRRSREYPILAGLDQVPAAVWRDRSLVVERFLPEEADGGFQLRSWVFLGDREVAYLNFSRRPIVKSYNVERHEPLAEIPEPIRRERIRLGFDYGKFDFVLHEGRPVLLDANPTPSVNGEWTERHREIGRQLAAGIDSRAAGGVAPAPPRAAPSRGAPGC